MPQLKPPRPSRVSLCKRYFNENKTGREVRHDERDQNFSYGSPHLLEKLIRIGGIIIFREDPRIDVFPVLHVIITEPSEVILPVLPLVAQELLHRRADCRVSLFPSWNPLL